jgi:hypothetical protein
VLDGRVTNDWVKLFENDRCVPAPHFKPRFPGPQPIMIIRHNTASLTHLQRDTTPHLKAEGRQPHSSGAGVVDGDLGRRLLRRWYRPSTHWPLDMRTNETTYSAHACIPPCAQVA